MKLNEIDLHLTNSCNLKCKHCVFSSGERKIKEMPTVVIEKIVRDFAQINSNGRINLFGGEPLLRVDILEIIKNIKQQGLTVGITTNCDVPNRRIEAVLDLGVDRMTTNLDGASAQTHDWLRNKKGNFEKVKKRLHYFVVKNVFSTVNSVMHADNIDEVVSILELCGDLGVNALAFYYMTPTGRGLNLIDKMVDPQKWFETNNKIIAWIEKNKPKFSISWEQAYETADDTHLFWRCEKDYSDSIFIRCDGEAYSCALLEGAPCSLGNFNQKPMKEILENRGKRAFSREKGCPGLSFHVNKDVYSKDPRIVTDLIKLGCPYEYRVLN